ncbi:hypothetical protein BDV12DRAFT_159748 [Aspergillus spectabilis]
MIGRQIQSGCRKDSVSHFVPLPGCHFSDLSRIREKYQGPFACGGTIDIAYNQQWDSPPAKKQRTDTNKRISASSRKTSPLVNVFWATETGSPTQ